MSSTQPSWARREVWPRAREVIAGSMSGVGLIVAGHPFDTIKVRLQSEGGYGRFKGPFDCLTTTMKQEGLRGLYKGAAAPLVGQGLVNSYMFGIYDTAMRVVCKDNKKGERGSISQVATAGLMTGACMFLVVTPMEGIKTRLQVQYSEAHTGVKARYSGPIHCTTSVYKEFGIGGIYRGWAPTFIARLAFGVYVSSYEVARRHLTRNSENGALSPVATLAAGGFAGTCYWLSHFPIDVVKNKMMAAPDVKPPLYKNARDCARQIYAAEGWKGFTRGLSVCLLRSVPANATCFLFLEMTRKMLPH